MLGDYQLRLTSSFAVFSFEKNPISSLSSPKLKNDALVISSNTLSPWNSNENAGVSFVLTVEPPTEILRINISG